MDNFLQSALLDDTLFNQLEKIGELGIYETDIGQQTFKASSHFQKMFHLPPQEHYPVETFQALVHPEDIEWVMKLYGDCITHHLPFDCEYRCLVEGKVMHVRSRSKIFYNEAGQPLKALGIKQDITSRKKLEIERKEFVQGLIKSKEVTSIIAHDLRSPVSTVISIVELLEDHTDQDGEVFLDKINLLCQRMNDIIDDVLELNKIEKDNISFDTHLQVLAPVIHAVVSTLSIKAQEKQISFSLDLDEAVMAEVNAQKVSRILDNLLSNAVKFSHKNSVVEIRLAEVQGKALISVKDHGIGMNEEQLKLLYRKFSKSNRKGTEGERSVGLGMSIVKRLVDLHQAEIKIESKVNEGTTVTLLFKSRQQ